MRKIKAYVVFKKDPFTAKFITFHKSEADKMASETEEMVECAVLIPLPDEKVIENLLKK